MTTSDFEVKADHELWRSLGMDVERFEKMRVMLGQAFAGSFLSQKKRPASMAYFDDLMSNIHTGRVSEILSAKKEGAPVVGTFCVFVPEELVLAAGGVCVGLCAGSQGSVPDAEKTLPRNICPMVKSAYGFKASAICPYFQSVDFVYGETTCDAKKKTWELLDRLVPTHVMEIPQMKRPRDRRLWLEEVGDFKEKIDSVAGTATTFAQVKEAVSVMNAKRRALQRLTALRGTSPSPISGKDALLITQLSFLDEPSRFAQKLEALCNELEARVHDGVGVAPVDAPRVMISGTPMALPNWKVHNVVEAAGAVVVNEESCIGTRYFKDLIDEDAGTMEELLEKLTDRYMKIDCSCFTPNTERVDRVIREFRSSGAEGIVHYCLQFCHTYNIEAIRIKEACEANGIPFIAIESDYSPEDVGQIQTRIEAFLEQIAEKR